MERIYDRPDTLEQALHIKAKFPTATVLAGGTDLLVYMREGKQTPQRLLDITGLSALRHIRQEGNTIIIGAMTTFTSIEQSVLLSNCFPALCCAAASVGSPQIRNRGTIGGSIANANPSGDIIPALVIAEASVTTVSERGTRVLSIEELITGIGKTSLMQDEIIQDIQFPVFAPGTKTLFSKIGRRNALAIARLNGACALRLHNDAIDGIRISIGAATNRPMRMHCAEALLNGKTPTNELLLQAGQAVSDYILELTGYRHSSNYKLPVARDMAVRLIRDTLQQGGIE